MNKLEMRFYNDFHKLVEIQKEILEELKKLNKPLQEDKEDYLEKTRNESE